MAKRFTDTEKWKDPWFCSLTERERGFWGYLVDNCDHAGIWQVNWFLVEHYFPGFPALFDFSKFEGRIIDLKDNRWFLKKFVLFQQGINNLEELNPDNNIHRSILKSISRCGVSLEGLPNSGTGVRQELGKGYSNSKSFKPLMINTNINKKVKKSNMIIQEHPADCVCQGLGRVWSEGSQKLIPCSGKER